MNDPKLGRPSERAVRASTAAALPKTFVVRAAVGGAPAEILLYDEIGPWGVTAKDFVGALASAGDGPVTVRINSPGGDVFDGLAIYHAIKAHSAPVTCTVDGVAASAASFIAMAGSTVEMGDKAMMMIHKALTVAGGNETDLRAAADLLAKVDEQLVGIYAGKTGKTAEDLSAMLAAETWMTADEAVAGGFADSISAVSPVKDRSRPLADMLSEPTRVRVAMEMRLRLAESAG